MSSEDKFVNNTPSRGILNNLQNKTARNFNSEHYSRRLLHYTPPSRFTKLRNPFEPHLAEKLHTNFFSPSVFKHNTPTLKVEEKFKWTIDEISSLRPADIDEEAEQWEAHEADSVIESSVQAKIDLFFSKSVVPSPFNQISKQLPLVTDNDSANSNIKRTCEASTQTILSLPMLLPKEVENALKPYFSCEEPSLVRNDEDLVLYRKLFDIDECDRSYETIESSPPKSLILSPIFPARQRLQPLDFDRNLESSINLDECKLSPIKARHCTTENGKASSTLDFSDQMSIDDSTNLVPDGSGRILKTKNFVGHANTSCSSVKELSSDSLENWDMEYNQIVIRTPSKTLKMDVSNSNTPKSKIFPSNRKNLSNSFISEDHPTKRVYNACTSFSDTTEVTDPGYQTGVTIPEDDYTNIYASTPSKKLLM